MNASPHVDVDPRRLLGRFLRARREAMRVPAQPGLRRRTPGLRREEVAQLAASSTTWYTWLEQGRRISRSAAALARVAGALSLSVAERAYLFELARQHDPAPAEGQEDRQLHAALVAAVQAMPMPAYLLDRGWRLEACNAAAAELFAPWLESGERCLLRFVFLEPAARRFIDDWETRAARLVAELHADTGQYPGDAGLAALVAELLQASTEFARCWERHRVLAREGGRRVFHHPRRGRVVHDQLALVPVGLPDRKLVLLMPVEPPASHEPGLP